MNRHEDTEGGTSNPGGVNHCRSRRRGHAEDVDIHEDASRLLSWVQGHISPAEEESLNRPIREQPIRFVPDLTKPHTTEDPIGIAIELFHHSALDIRLLAARGLPIVWYPRNWTLYVGHRSFRMSPISIESCSLVSNNDSAWRPSVEDFRVEVNNALTSMYHDEFDYWKSTGGLRADGPRAIRILSALDVAWSRPEFETTFDHLDFRDVVINAFRAAAWRGNSRPQAE